MAPSPTQLAAISLQGLISRFQRAIDKSIESDYQLLILRCMLGFQVEEALFKNTISLLLKTDQPFDKIDWSAAERLLNAKLGAYYLVHKDCIERVLAAVGELALLTHPDYGQDDDCAWKRLEMISDVTEEQVFWQTANNPVQETGARREVRFVDDKEGFEEEDTAIITIYVPAEHPHQSLCDYMSTNQEPENNRRPVHLVSYSQSLSLNMRPMANTGGDWTAASVVQLEQHFGGRGERSLSTPERLQLSIRVASAALFLYSTPWLAESWRSTDLYFFHGGDNVDFNPWAVNSSTVVAPTRYANTSTDPTTLSLCRFLVELWFSAPWSQVRNVYGPRRQLGDDDEDTNADRDVIKTILNWASDDSVSPHDRPFHEEGSLYVEAIRNCLDCDFGQVETSMTDRAFREGVYTKILWPLQWAQDDFLTSQLKLYGATREAAAGELTKSRMFGGDYLFDEVADTDSTKDRTTDDWFNSFDQVKEVAKRIRKDRPSQPEQRIRVAILDTGVDLQDPFLNPFKIKKRIFYQDFAQPGSSSRLAEDKVGHGTHICGVLLTIADNIDVYVARVSVDGKHWNGSQVAKAIDWAVVDKKVHIISISFGFPYFIRHLDPIRRAILRANAADVLIFAAASNKGGNQRVTFPASMDEVISVGSTDGNGVKSPFTPNLQHGKRLCTLGERIESSWPPGLLKADEATPRKSGTSFATPVAAGIAATVLDCMWACKEDSKYKTHIPKLLTRRGMLAVFKEMVEEYPNSHEYLVPWKLFSYHVNGDLDRDDSGDEMDIDMDATNIANRLKETASGSGIFDKIISTLRIL
ncbi:hypothetical protein NHJ13734_009487 [Beauveria thailandica]